MCGIGAYICKSGADRDRIESGLQAINEIQYHRGPDDSGIYVDSNVGLCHDRLSIIDLSEKAHQPFVTADGDFVITYNGEVYNFRELREQLQGLGHNFRSTSDTEVVLESYIEWGTDAFTRFDGMFAFAIYDKQAGKVVIARDRLGIKMAHYYVDDRMIIVASEIKSILKLLDNARFRPEAIYDVFMVGHIEGPLTMFKDIHTLMPGRYCEIDLKTFGLEMNTYFNLLDRIEPERYLENRGKPMDHYVDELEALLKDSVEMHLVSDAPLGSLCSGGVDSTLVTAMATGINPDVRIYHACAEDAELEERYAGMAAEHLGININYARINKSKYVELLVDTIYHLDSPTYHPNDIPLYAVCKLAHSQGVKVLLCGEGGDELFGGYSWQKTLMDKAAFKALAEENRYGRYAVGRIKNWLFNRVDYSNDYLDDYIYSAGVLQPYGRVSNYLTLKGYSLVWDKGENLRRWNEIVDSFDFLKDRRELCGNAVMVDNILGHLTTILYKTDRMGMMATIENRVPFLENNMIDFAVNLPLEYKIKGRSAKKVLKMVAERHLPRRIIYRKKEGFAVAWTKYIEYYDSLFEDGFVSNFAGVPSRILKRIADNDPYTLFRLLAVEIWGRIYIQNESRESIRDRMRVA